MSFTVTVPPRTGPEIVVTSASDKRTFNVVNNAVQVDTQADAELLAGLIEGATVVDDSSQAPPQTDSSPSNEGAPQA